MTELISRSEAETMRAGEALAADLDAGSTVLIVGTLGAGKTAFVRGLAAGAGCDPAEVSSPTFALIQPYAGRVTVQHVDLYRLTPREAEDLHLDELLDTDLVAVEWPDRWLRPPADAWQVTIARVDDTSRRITILPPPDHSTR